jgi:hypothetical protein
MAVAVTDVRELRQLEQALALLDPVPEWVQTTNEPSGVWIVRPGSPLALDDEATAPYHLSHYAWNALTVAVDTLHCLRRTLIEQDGTSQRRVLLHTHGQAPLLRGSLENAARVVWLLSHDHRKQRVYRRLGLQAKENTASDQIHKIVGATPPRSTQVRTDQIRGLGKNAGLSPSQLRKLVNSHEFGYGRIVTEAASQAGLDPELARLAWNGCSALSHGDFHATISLLQKEIVARDETGVLARITMSVPLLHAATTVATTLVEVAFDLYRRLAGRQL